MKNFTYNKQLELDNKKLRKELKILKNIIVNKNHKIEKLEEDINNYKEFIDLTSCYTKYGFIQYLLDYKKGDIK